MGIRSSGKREIRSSRKLEAARYREKEIRSCEKNKSSTGKRETGRNKPLKWKAESSRKQEGRSRGKLGSNAGIKNLETRNKNQRSIHFIPLFLPIFIPLFLPIFNYNIGSRLSVWQSINLSSAKNRGQRAKVVCKSVRADPRVLRSFANNYNLFLIDRTRVPNHNE